MRGWVLFLLITGVAHAGPPVVHVRGKAEIQLREITRIRQGVEVRGRVTDAQLRSGIAGQRLLVVARRGGRFQSFPVDADAFGRFEARLPLPPGVYHVGVLAPDGPHYAAARSPQQRIDLSVPIQWRWLAFPLTGTALVLLVGLLLYLRPWHRRRAAGEKPLAPRRIAGGLTVDPVGALGALRPRHDLGLAGVVCDVYLDRAVTGALLRVTPVDEPTAEPVTCRTTPGGRFSIDRLEPGRHRVEVRALGYVTEEFAVTVPHRGELRRARIDLLPVRIRLAELYRDAALRVLPDPDLLWVWTPRELLHHAPRPALQRLTEMIEEAYYSSRVTDEAALGEAQQLATQVGRSAV